MASKRAPAFVVREGSSSVAGYKYGAPAYGIDKASDRAARYCLAWYRFAAAVPDLAAASDEVLRNYLRELRTRKGRPVGPRRRDNVRDAFVRLFRFARDREYLAHDRTSAAEKIERLNPGAEIATFTPA